MCKSPPSLTHSFFTICKIIRFEGDKKVFFGSARRVQPCLGWPKVYVLYMMLMERLDFLLHRWVVHMSKKPHTKRGRGTWCNNFFPIRGYAEIHLHKHFFKVFFGIGKYRIWKIQTVWTYFHIMSRSRKILISKIIHSGIPLNMQNRKC
jgi:hypothetical protein